MGCAASTVDNNPIAQHLDSPSSKYPIVGDNSIMRPKAHGTCASSVQSPLRWQVDVNEADKICNYNRHYAESSGKFERNRLFQKEIVRAKKKKQRIEFYDSNTGHLLFRAPVGRSHEQFWYESQDHGWPSFRDAEVNWEHVRCLGNGEAVSLAGTHLGHNLPDRKGNRYCINLCCVAGQPKVTE